MAGCPDGVSVDRPTLTVALADAAAVLTVDSPVTRSSSALSAAPGARVRLGVHRLLDGIDPVELREFATETLGPLAEPGGEAADLRHTLEVLLDTNLNIAQASRILHFHYNTLRYRIGKLERMVGPFTTDSRVRLGLHLALQVLELRPR